MFDDVLSPAQLRVLLERERERADRSGKTLSYICFSFRAENGAVSQFAPLVHVLRRRLRISDEIGWLDTDRLGVVLPYTPHEGAATVAEHVIEACPADMSKPEFEIYCYPFDARMTREGSGTLVSTGELNLVQPLEMLLMRPLPLWKRVLDVAGALIGILLLAPVLLAIAIAVRWSSPGPIIFRQRRSGLGGRPFMMYKFRTMCVDAHQERESLLDLNEQDGPAFKIKNDPRVTRLGRFLRRLSIDELPQLWNVVIGNMSLVGPRPLPCEESDSCRGWHRRRTDVTPGITCIWQVTGRSTVSFDNWVRMDVRYITSRTLRHDLKLLFQTLPAVLQGKGAS